MSGMGYIFSREGLRRLYIRFVSNTCPMPDPTLEDVDIGGCLAHDVMQVDTRDEKKRLTFLHAGIEAEILLNEPDWIKEHSYNHFSTGLDCCAPKLVGTHHISLEFMFFLNHLVRNFRVFGHQKFEKEPKPPRKLTREEVELSTL